MRSVPAVLVGGLAGLVLLSGLSGCSSSNGDDHTPVVDAVRPDGSPADPDTWPLTGLPVRNGRSSALPHPVLVAKIDNTAASAPQTGLRAADLVVEELVEGGVTRLAAFYHSKLPDEVGPVRSMRASDIGIVSPVQGEMVTSGAAPVTIRRVTAAGLDFVTEGSPGFARESSRSAPYNLFADLLQVAEEVRTRRERPDDYLPWADRDASLPKNSSATSIQARFSGGHTTEWTYRDGAYVNDNSFASEGDAFRADSVLVLRVEVGDAGYLDPAKNPVPETDLSGTGEALLFHGGRMVQGTWRKKDLDSAVWLGAGGGELEVPAGRVWIELVPEETGEVSVD